MQTHDELEDLERRLGHGFGDRGLLLEALTHRSYLGAPRDQAAGHYERLEFLGDALLGFVVSEWLWRDDPAASEGVLTRRKQTVVRTPTLAAAARRLGLGDALRLGGGERSSGGTRKPSLLADAFEAVVGAVFLDAGIRKTRAFVVRQLRDELRATRSTEIVPEDAKTRLQEHVQQKLRATPVYRLIETTGPSHRPEFVAEVRVGRRCLGRGRGSSRKRAEQQAAGEALRAIAAGGLTGSGTRRK